MSKDLETRLRDWASKMPNRVESAACIESEAADEIARLKAENERLRNALRKIYGTGDDGTQDEIAPDMWSACREFAQEALNYD